MESELLDPTLDKLIIKWEGERDWFDLDAEIQKENGKKIGKIKIPQARSRGEKKACLFDTDDEIILFTQFKRQSRFRTKYEIKDSNENLIGTPKSTFRPLDIKMFMENSQGIKILKGKMDGRWKDKESHRFDRMDGTNVVKFNWETKKVKQSFWNSTIYNTCSLTINDLTYDRKIVLGFFVAYLTDIFDYTSGGGDGGGGGGGG